jgi:polysaccharide deacetylase family protein (PEP-CTERM system associated)
MAEEEVEMSNGIVNALSVDVEDYFQVSAFEKCIDRSLWDEYPLRVVENTHRILDLFDQYSVAATFFVLGWVAERAKGLVPLIASRGHEVACHGYGHQLVYDIGPKAFREDIRKAKSILEEQAGMEVGGYRAPSYSITNKSLWALDILIEEGFKYDSSIFPVHHDLYGIPGSERYPYSHTREGGVLPEFPITTYPMNFLGKGVDLPFSGGGYFRLFPYWLVDKGIRYVNETELQPAMVYFHPWEVDPGQPRVEGARLKSRFRHYVNLSSTMGKLEKLLAGHEFTRVDQVLGFS